MRPGPGKAWLSHLALPCLAYLASDRPRSPAPRNNSPAAFGGRAARSAAAVVAGAGKASEADARQDEPSQARPGAYNPCASGTITFGNIFGNMHPEKTEEKRYFLFERNPLPGSDSARHLEPDALILARCGAVRGQISHKKYFSQNLGATF